MPGYVIHIAIAKKYIEKHPKEIKNEKEFIKGTIYPDTVDIKATSHYGKSPAYTNLKNFIENNNISTDFEKGHFLHLIADYLFYNDYLDEIPAGGLYNDYDIINKDLMEKYNVELPNEIKDKVFFVDGIPKKLNYESVCDFIEKVASLDFKTVINEVENKNKKWNIYKKLI